jgi:hypothetical protein
VKPMFSLYLIPVLLLTFLFFVLSSSFLLELKMIYFLFSPMRQRPNPFFVGHNYVSVYCIIIQVVMDCAS